MKETKRTFKKLIGAIAGILVFGSVAKISSFIIPVIGILILSNTNIDISKGSETAQSLLDIGLIIGVIGGFYLSIKTFKKILGN